MTVSITPQMTMTASETLDPASNEGATTPIVTQAAFNLSGPAMSANTTPRVDKASYKSHTLTAGAKTIDLTALQGVNDVAIDATGLKLQTIIIKNPVGNNPMTIGEGAVNGYPIFGAANDLTVPGGCTMTMIFNDQLVDVGATDLAIDIVGTGTESVDIGICLG